MPRSIKDDPLYEAYTKKIKERLNAKRKDETIPQILKGLNAMGFNFSIRSISDTLNLNNSTLNTVIVIALCKYWDIDSSIIFAEPDAIIDTDDLAASVAMGENFEPLRDKTYEGEFFCYLYPRKNYCDELLTASLKIHIYEESSRVIFTISESDELFKSATPKGKTLTGIPYYSKASNTILMLLHNDFGIYFFISFKYEPYYHGHLYYRTATFISYTIDIERSPRIQKMVLLAHKAEEKNLKYIRGLLKLNTEHITIRVEDLKNLAKQDPDIKTFYEKFYEDLERNRHDCYIFNQSTLITPFKKFEPQDFLTFYAINDHSLSNFFTETKVPRIVCGLSKKF